jgi:hypothetical protein
MPSASWLSVNWEELVFIVGVGMLSLSWLFRVSAMVLAISLGVATGGGGKGSGADALDYLSSASEKSEAVSCVLA